MFTDEELCSPSLVKDRRVSWISDAPRVTFCPRELQVRFPCLLPTVADSFSSSPPSFDTLFRVFSLVAILLGGRGTLLLAMQGAESRSGVRYLESLFMFRSVSGHKLVIGWGALNHESQGQVGGILLNE